LEVGSRPKGWEGEAFGVQTEKDRRCLEVTKESNELFYVQLPALAIKGDFAMDCEFRLGGQNANRSPFLGGPNSFGGTNTGDHEFHLELASRSSTPLRVAVDHMATVKIDAGQAKGTEGFKAFAPIRFRLTRKGDVYNVSINDHITVGRTISGKGVFQTVRIGLTGGKSQYGGFGGGGVGAFLACLYSVKITSLEPGGAKPDDAVTTPAPLSVQEDFSKAAAGTLPDGWKGGKTANLAVQKKGDLADLELVNPALGGDVTLPKVELKGDFYADVSAVLTEQNTALKVLFKGGAKTKTLAVELDYGGGVTAGGRPKADGSKSWIQGKPNVLRIERSGKDNGYVIKLNDTEVGAVPLSAAPGPFTQVELVIVIKERSRGDVQLFGGPGSSLAKKKSPQITSVQVVPLEEAP
jgi:hypothetical protein